VKTTALQHINADKIQLAKAAVRPDRSLRVAEDRCVGSDAIRHRAADPAHARTEGEPLLRRCHGLPHSGEQVGVKPEKCTPGMPSTVTKSVPGDQLMPGLIQGGTPFG
jgi:hypothetical protein